jgi:hypothetical protein
MVQPFFLGLSVVIRRVALMAVGSRAVTIIIDNAYIRVHMTSKLITVCGLFEMFIKK